MKIRSIRIENYRSFKDETVFLNRYSCFVGPNGSGKSTILCALNVFFRDQASSTTDVKNLTDEDYFEKNISMPIRISVCFDDLNEKVRAELSAYVRNDELVVSAEAHFDDEAGFGQVRHFGQRSGIADFRRFFEADKAGAKAPELNGIYEELKKQYPELSNARSKDDKINALREYEEANPAKCELIPSEDNFYGINSTGKLASFIQWVYVPAVKDMIEEGQEAKNTALGKLIARAVRVRTNFDEELDSLKQETLTKYKTLLEKNQSSLNDISVALQRRLEAWAHPNVRIGMEWLSDPSRAVALQPPIAGIKTGEGGFLGNLARMGHGLQRSYLLALLQELAASETDDAPTLLLGCEEPELYQHPPQARYMAEVFAELATGNNQVLVTTHSPLFVSGDGFENVRMVSNIIRAEGAKVRSLSYESLCKIIRGVLGEDTQREIDGLIAKIHQALQPGISEMFFSHFPILVEGLEDAAYLTAGMYLSGLWNDFRRFGCHLVPVNCKDKLIQPLAIAMELKIPVFVIFDSDGNIQGPEKRKQHERDNRALLNLLNAPSEPFPDDHIWGSNYVVWKSNIGEAIKCDFDIQDYERIREDTRVHYSQEGGLEKNEMFIADWLTAASIESLKSNTLIKLCQTIINFAKTPAVS